APGWPGTWRSKVGCEAIDEPCTNRIVPRSWVFCARRFSHRNSLASPFLVQCSLPWMWMLSTCVVTRRLLYGDKRDRFGKYCLAGVLSGFWLVLPGGGISVYRQKLMMQ